MFDSDAMTAEEVAGMLRISKNSVYRMAQSGELASYRVGRKLRFTLRDVEEYIQKRTRGDDGGQAAEAGACAATAVQTPPANALEGALPFPLDERTPFVIAGNDLSGDIIAHALSAEGFPVSRAYVGSYTALVNLYARRANAALVHLYDRKTNTYNVPAIQRIVPGTSVIVIRLLKRKQGFLVQRGNPKKLTTWGGLLRGDVYLANRARGCGTRALIDEKLISLEARPETIEGYAQECATGLETATLVACGRADVAVGTEKLARQVAGLDFVPLQTEWLDIAIEKSERTMPIVRSLQRITESDAFRKEIDALEGCEATNTGVVVYEC